MATSFHLPATTSQLATASQVGAYFVGKYYQALQHRPEFVYQFYSNSSSMLRIHGNTIETATALEQIHTLVMSLKYNGIEIETVHSLKSWNGGVLVMVSGSVQAKNFSGRRKFFQTFFLAPQVKGYFVLNDIIHFIDDESLYPHPVTNISQSNLDSKLNASVTIQESVPNYVLGRETEGWEFVAPVDVKENGQVENYNFSEQQMQNTPEAESILEDNFTRSNGLLPNSMNPVLDHMSVPIEETVGEPQKHTYASIVAKGQSATSHPRSSFYKSTPPAFEWNRVRAPPTQLSVASSTAVERLETEAAEEEGELKSIYVKNLPTTVSAFEIEEQFKKFGRLKPDGVVIRNRQECYAFVEYEDVTGAENAIQAATVQIAGQHVFIQRKRANRINAYRGGRWGRGSGSYRTEASRGCFGSQSFGRRNGHVGGDRDYRPRGNGSYRPAPW